MKTLLYTGHDAAYKPLADITVPRMAEYAEHRGMDFTCYTEPLIDVPHGIYWTGVCGALKAFKEGYDPVMYLDVDQLITNYDVVWPTMTKGFHASQDWGTDAVDPWHFSMCGFMALRSAEVIFTAALEAESEWRDKPFPEQGPMQWYVKMMMGELPHMQAMRENKEGYEAFINIHPRKVFNCVPDEVAPGNVHEPWQPGDFAAHLTMLPLNERVILANKILSKL